MIQHATREVVPTQLDACIDFYGEIGFARVPQPAPLEGRAVWLEHRQTQIHLMPKPDAVPQSGHIAVVVARYEDTVARLRDLGHEVEPRPEYWGAPRSYVRDPAGNLVELMAWPPGATAPPAWAQSA
ncbi:MAG: VOC family protein [Solirubrobacteraceae bacterium]|jgi:catechol 2,3-dioxygenase-like lactoylglutathione lyase family enzyme